MNNSETGGRPRESLLAYLCTRHTDLIGREVGAIDARGAGRLTAEEYRGLMDGWEGIRHELMKIADACLRGHEFDRWDFHSRQGLQRLSSALEDAGVSADVTTMLY